MVGRGASADVLAWRDGAVVKLFHPRWAFSADMEHQRARAVQALGAPCPAVFERVEHGGRTGIVYERVDGPLLLDLIRSGSLSAAQGAGRLAELHAALHAVAIPEASPLPRLRDLIARFFAKWPDAERARAAAELARLPAETGLCHGDLHPGNVIVHPRGLVVVDWVNASAGPLALDVARSFALIAWQGAERRDGARQAGRLEFAALYRAAMAPHVPEADLTRALGFGCDALLRHEPQNPFAPELCAAIPWR